MKFKKLAALTLAGAMSLSLAACGGGGGDPAAPRLPCPQHRIPLRRHRHPRA